MGKTTFWSLLAAIMILSALAVLPAAAWGGGYGGYGGYNGYYGGDDNCGGYDNNWDYDCHDGWGDWNGWWDWDCHDGWGWPTWPDGGDGDGDCGYHPPCHPPCSEVPEPSSLALLGGGLATFVSWVGIRRGKKTA